MSILYVDDIRGKTAAASVDLSNATNIRMPPGHIIQVVESTTSTDESFTSTSFVNTSVTANITPKFNNSLIKIECLFHFHQQSSGTGGDVMLARDVGGTITNLTGSGQDFFIRQHTNDSDFFYFPVHLFATDTPSTTNSTTYRLRVKVASSGGVEIFNNRGKGRMMLTEIAQ